MASDITERPTETDAAFAQRFAALVATWNKDTRFLSNPVQVMGHPAMRAIVAMGEPVVPLILHELTVRPDLLVWALPEIVGSQPEFEGNVNKMTEAWLQWGREKGIV